MFFTQIVFAGQAGLNDEEMARLHRGEILLQTINADKPGAAARVTALLHTSADNVWEILGYCKYELIYVKGLKICEVLDGDQFQMTVRHRLRNSWYTPNIDFVFAASRDSSGTGRATLVSGDLRVFDGQWKLYPMEGENSVIVVHEIRVQSRFPAPKWLIRRTLHNDLPDMLACIRGLADASGTDRHIQRDLKRCSGDVSQLDK
ncbi:MAG: hypothetical protein GQ538_11580 [Xanthomonadales bacterium]|nr:hypothetical protein [Xanthomonadales bacterium]